MSEKVLFALLCINPLYWNIFVHSWMVATVRENKEVAREKYMDKRDKGKKV